MPTKPALSAAALTLIARRFALLSKPARLRLIQALFEGEKSVNMLAAETGGTQTSTSRHLQALSDAQILTRRRDGVQVFYSIADPSITQLCEVVCGSLARQLTQQAASLAKTRLR